MNKYFLLFAIFFVTILSGCGSDEPDIDLFRMSVQPDGEAEIAAGLHSAEISLNGLEHTFIVFLEGDYDSFNLSDNIAEWITPSVTSKQISIYVSRFSGEGQRSSKVGFTVFKGNESQTGYIEITQNALTYETLLNQERKAIANYLSHHTVINALPNNNEYQTGTNAPYYKINDNVFMQVVNLGSASPAEIGEKIYFRYTRYPIGVDGSLGTSTGNTSDMSYPLYFVFDPTNETTAQLGEGILMPLQLSLPLGSDVNLVISSLAGPTAEMPYVVPFLYNIRYYREVM